MRTVGIETEFPFYYNRMMPELCALIEEMSQATGHPFINFFDRYGIPKNHWCLKSEGSRIEITSPPVEDARKLLPAYKLVKPVLSKQTEVNNHRTGIHVHVFVRDFTSAKLCQLIGEMARFEDFLFHIQPKHRRDCGWCRPLKRIFSGELQRSQQIGRVPVSRRVKGLDFWKRVDSRDFEKLTRGMRGGSFCSKGIAMNVYPYFEAYGTAEFRIANWTYEAEDIVNWARLCHCFVEAIANRKSSLPGSRRLSAFLKNIKAPDDVADWAKKKTRENKEGQRVALSLRR